MSSSELFELPSSPASTSTESSSAMRGTSQSLYRKYRPQSFAEDELVGQEHIVQTLRNAITLGRVAHAYLFCGPRGTGKTTTARLLAKAVNCEHPDPAVRPCNACPACEAINSGSTTDVIEIDAASNRGIDDIRDLRERVKYAPTQLATKFYIIDEAHQITGAAANAFLKTLEEPPLHTRFVLATTDPEELLPTIVSRCQRFDFRKISLDAAVRRLQTIVDAEGLSADRAALEAIARHGTGSLRDGVGLLDQLSVYQDEAGDSGERRITLEGVNRLLGISRNDRIVGLVAAIAEADAGKALELVNEAIDAGEDARQLNRQLVAYLRELLFARAGSARTSDNEIKETAARFSINELSELARLFSEVDFKIKRSLYGQLPLEIALVDAVTRNTRSRSVEREAQPSAQTTSASRPTIVQPTHAEVIEEKAPTNRLSNRIKQTQPTRPTPQPERIQPPPLQVAPPPGIVRTEPASSPSDTGATERQTAQPTPTGETLSVDRIAELWMQIRLDVKSVDRRVEALLAAADPYDVNGNEVHLVTPYDFHARKLNEDAPRNLVSDVIGRIFGQRVVVTSHQVGQTPPRSMSSSSPTPTREPETVAEREKSVAQQETAPVDEPPDPEPEIDIDAILEERTKAAMSIFDAVPIKDPGRPTRD